MSKMTLDQWFKENDWDTYFRLHEEKCEGQYRDVFARCGGALILDSVDGNYKGIKCPNHEGESDDNYRAKKSGKGGRSMPFDDYAFGYCNTCGPKRGITHLMWLRQDHKLKDTLKAIRHGMGWTLGYVLNQPDLDRELTPQEKEKFKRDEEARKKQLLELKAKREADELKRQSKRAAFLKGVMKDQVKGAVSLGSPEARPVQLYLESRGITNYLNYVHLLDEWIKYVPASQVYVNDVDYGLHRCMAARIVNGLGQTLYFHRTIVDESGAKYKPTKYEGVDGQNVKREASDKLKGSAIPGLENSNRGIKPFHSMANSIMGVCEGIEVGLSIFDKTEFPVDMAADAHGVMAWRPKKGVKFAVIFEDYDLPNRNYPNDGGTGAAAGDSLSETLIELGVVPIRLSPPFSIPEGKNQSIIMT